MYVRTWSDPGTVADSIGHRAVSIEFRSVPLSWYEEIPRVLHHVDRSRREINGEKERRGGGDPRGLWREFEESPANRFKTSVFREREGRGEEELSVDDSPVTSVIRRNTVNESTRIAGPRVRPRFRRAPTSIRSVRPGDVPIGETREQGRTGRRRENEEARRRDGERNGGGSGCDCERRDRAGRIPGGFREDTGTVRARSMQMREYIYLGTTPMYFLGASGRIVGGELNRPRDSPP